MSVPPDVSPSQLRFHTRGLTAFQDPTPIGTYPETPHLLTAVAKAAHAELGLGADAFINGGGMLHSARTLTDTPELDVSFGIVGVKKSTGGDYLLVSVLVHEAVADGQSVTAAWSPDLDPTAPGKPLTMGYYQKRDDGQFWLAPLPDALKATIKGMSGKAAGRAAKPAAKASDAILCGDGDVYRVAFSPDGRVIATADGTGQVRLYDAATGALAGAVSVGKVPCHALAFLPDGKTVVAGTHHLSTIDVATAKPIAKLSVHGDAITALAVSPSGKRVASAGKGKLIVWDLEANEKRYAATAYDVHALAFEGDDRVLAALGTYTGFKRFDLGAKPPKNGPADILGPRAFAPTREGWLTMHTIGAFVIHDRETLALGRSVETPKVGEVFATDGADRLVVEESQGSPAALLLDVRSGAVIHRLVAQSPTGVGEPSIHCFAFAPDGRIAVGAGRGVTVWTADGTLHLGPRA